MEAYERLANAVVIKAAKDYRRALKKLSRNHNNLDAMSEIASIERFFRSGWFCSWSSGSGGRDSS